MVEGAAIFCDGARGRPEGQSMEIERPYHEVAATVSSV
jgi:hypothetical protein